MEHVAVHYLWWIVALVLIGGEVILPGYFMLWIGIGAAATGLVLLLVPDLGPLAQAIVFGVLAFVSCFIYWKFVRPRLERVPAGNARLNRRGEQLLGRRLDVIHLLTLSRITPHARRLTACRRRKDAPTSGVARR